MKDQEVCSSSAKVEHPSEHDASIKIDSQNWKDKLTNPHQCLAALDGAIRAL